MSRQYTYAGATAPRHSNNHGTSSAFSSSANPDEDWTKISDLAERRRIQNRIAQRNYRKKLKRRLEDLERRAGSSSESPPQVHAELHKANRVNEKSNQQFKRSPETVHRQPSPRLLSSQYTPPMQDDDVLFSNSFDREGSRTPPLFPYHHTYPAPEDIEYPPYPQPQQYRISSGGDYSDYLAPIPVTLPSMLHFHDTLKRDDDTMNPYSMSYQGLPSIELHGSHGYGDSGPHTPPLSHSYDHSTTCSESGYQYPTTPLSMPASPRLMSHI